MGMLSEPSGGFLMASAGGVVLGNVIAVLAPVAGASSQAFLGSIVASGLLGFVFTIRTIQLLRAHQAVGIPAASLSAVFGIWFMGAPLLYGTDAVGALGTAGTQFGGLLMAAFGTYLLIHGLVDARIE